MMRWPMKIILMQCSGATFSVGIFACNSGVPRSLRTKYCISKHISLLLKRVNKWWWWLVGHRDLFHAELKLLILAKLLIYETEEVTGQSKFAQLQHECLVLWNKVVPLEESHARDNADRTTLIYIMDQRIVEIVLYTSLSVSRVSIMLLTGSCWVQFLARPPRNGQISLEKMNLINAVDQLLLEMNKLKSEKTSLEEELKMHGHTLACYHIKGTVTAPRCSPDCQ